MPVFFTVVVLTAVEYRSFLQVDRAEVEEHTFVLKQELSAAKLRDLETSEKLEDIRRSSSGVAIGSSSDSSQQG